MISIETGGLWIIYLRVAQSGQSPRFGTGLSQVQILPRRPDLMFCPAGQIGKVSGFRSRSFGVRLPGGAPGLCCAGLQVRSSPFQGDQTGSIPVRNTS